LVSLERAEEEDMAGTHFFLFLSSFYPSNLMKTNFSGAHCPCTVCCANALHLPIDSKILNLSPPVESESLDTRFKEERGGGNQLDIRVALSAMNLPSERLSRSIPCR